MARHLVSGLILKNEESNLAQGSNPQVAKPEEKGVNIYNCR